MIRITLEMDRASYDRLRRVALAAGPLADFDPPMALIRRIVLAVENDRKTILLSEPQHGQEESNQESSEETKRPGPG